MKEYRYKALTPTGQMVAGIRHADSAAELADDLFSRNLVLLDSRLTLGSIGKAFSVAGLAGRRDLRDFTLHLGTCLAAGIPVTTALHDFENDSATGSFKAVIADIREEISSGSQVSGALAKHPEVFSDVYLAIISAGEDSGNLAQSFADLVEYLEWMDELQGRTKQALMYPLILVCGVVGLFLLMFTFVLPRFMGIFQQGAIELPQLTLMVMATFNWFRTWWLLVVTCVVGTAAALTFLRGLDSGRYWMDAALLRLPVIGGFVHKIALSRFSKHFSLLFRAGTGLPRLLELLGDVVGNAKMRREVIEIRSRVMTGETLAASFRQAPSFPPLIQRLVAVGEQAGQLDNSLMKAAEYLDREIPRALKQAFTLMEAILLCVLGALIAIAALSVILPILNMQSAMT